MNGRVVVITGASGGIGAALARRAAAAGAHVVLAGRRARELAEVADACGSNALPVTTDVTRREEVERLLAAAIDRFGHVDAWVNNAGRGISRVVSQISDEDFDEMMRVNVKSALYGMQTVLPHFQERGRGHIVNVSSMLGRIPFAPFRSSYNAAKAALNALTTSLRLELRGRWPEIHVTTVSPPVVATDFGLNALHGGPDSRTLPNAQPADEVADVILETLRHPRADVYTRAGLRDQVVAYYSAEDMGAYEAGFARTPPVVSQP